MSGLVETAEFTHRSRLALPGGLDVFVGELFSYIFPGSENSFHQIGVCGVNRSNTVNRLISVPHTEALQI